MDLISIIKYRSKKIIGNRRHFRVGFLIPWIILCFVTISCETEHSEPNWFDQDIFTICQYLEIHKTEYSKFYRLLEDGEMLSALCAYNPYGEDYTLFLPTDEAVDQFIQKNQDYDNFEELLQDTGFIHTLTRYHTLNKKLHADEFPDGAIADKTLTGDRLTIGFFTDGDNAVIKVNNTAPIIKANLEMTNGFVHVISSVLQKADIPGYDWLQEQEGYSILAEAMELSGIRRRLWMDKYTILAEHDSVYNRNGIFNIYDLRNRVATIGIYNFAAFHIMGGEFYLNDLYWGNRKYWTVGNEQLVIDVGGEIRINPGVNTYGIVISESGDTTVIDYIRPVWEGCNILTGTGPVHSISDLLYSKQLN